jgi:large subunit ribosomal protein L4
MVRLALRSALSDRADSERIKVIDAWGIDEPKTSRAIEVLDSLGLRPTGAKLPRVLVVLDRSEHAVWKSFRNLGDHVQIVLPEELNAHDVILNDWIVFSRASLDAAVARYSPASPTTARRARHREP